MRGVNPMGTARPSLASRRQGGLDSPGEARLLSELEASALDVIPEYMAHLYQVVPLRVRDGVLELAATSVHSSLARLVQDITGLEVRWRLVPAQDIGEELLSGCHGRARPGDGKDEKRMITWAPAVVDSLLAGAAKAGASDLHMEPGEDSALFRYRIDGSLVDVGTIPLPNYRWVVNRVKVLAGMNVVEHHSPQDGRAVVNTKEGVVTVRATVVPTLNGERIACRLVDRGRGLLPLERLGFESHILRCFKESVMSRLPGLTVIAGPTGSGKTTTLYSTLLDMGGTNVVTMEDPVEWRLPGATQIEVKPGKGWTFGSGLSAALRTDPDVLVIGEVRCEESARVTLTAASTGHRVLCSLHAPDALSALRRLSEYGGPGSSAVPPVNCVVAQRLVRRICSRCIQRVALAKEERDHLKRLGGSYVTTAFRGKGCPHCSGTGYRGRSGVFEFLVPTAQVRSLLVQSGPEGLVPALGSTDYWSLSADMVSKVERGITSVQEVMEIAYPVCTSTWDRRVDEKGEGV
jgi:type II secretory ATPase GspE/PulE/Tfp pilus assembly ATPase PilB-like protein